jgi:hypothetical protein
MDAAGRTLAIVGPSAVWIYTNYTGIWSEQSRIDTSGNRISLSAGGDTLAIGYPGYSGGAGTTLIYSYGSILGPTPTWTQQAQLVGSNATGAASQGKSVTLSADGNTVAFGGDQDAATNVGATWVFTRSGSVWRQRGGKLVGTPIVDTIEDAQQGYSVSLSGDGNTLAVGAIQDGASAQGAVYVFI